MHGGFATRDLDIVVNHARLERARAVQRNRCDDVRETVRWEPAKQAHIQRALNLEQAVHIARSHKLESLRVFGRNLLGNKLDAITLFHVAARARKHAQRTQAQEVHLQQTQVRRIVTVILRNNAATFGIALHGNMVGHGVAANNSRACVHALAAHIALNRACSVDDFFGFGLLVVSLLEIGIRIERLVDRDAQFVADHFAQSVAHAIRLAKHASRVANGVLRLQLAERDNARHVVFAIEILDMLNDFLASLVLEVDVDIRHLNAFGRQEALEQQAVRQGIKVGNAHGIRANSACGRATARAYGNTILSRPANVFLDNEEVCREALLNNNARLVHIAVPCVFRNGFAIAALQAIFAFLAEQRFFGVSRRQGKARQNGIALKHNIAFLSNLHRGIARLGEISQRFAHFLFGLHIELIVREAHAVLIVHERACANAQHKILRASVFAAKVMEVVRRDGLQAELIRNVGQMPIHLALAHTTVSGNALVLQLDVEITRLV